MTTRWRLLMFVFLSGLGVAAFSQAYRDGSKLLISAEEVQPTQEAVSLPLPEMEQTVQRSQAKERLARALSISQMTVQEAIREFSLLDSASPAMLAAMNCDFACVPVNLRFGCSTVHYALSYLNAWESMRQAGVEAGILSQWCGIACSQSLPFLYLLPHETAEV